MKIEPTLYEIRERPRVFAFNEATLHFHTLADFRQSMGRGGEAWFEWNGGEYSVCWDQQAGRYHIGPTPGPYAYYDTVDELLGHIIDGRPLRDVITKAAVVDRWC